MLKLKLQYFGHLIRRADILEKTLMLGKIEGRRRKGWQRTRWLEASLKQWTWVWANSKRWWRAGKPGLLQSMELQRVGHNLVTKLQSAFNAEKWTFRMSNIKIFIFTQEICIIKFLFEQILATDYQITVTVHIYIK